MTKTVYTNTSDTMRRALHLFPAARHNFYTIRFKTLPYVGLLAFHKLHRLILHRKCIDSVVKQAFYSWKIRIGTKMRFIQHAVSVTFSLFTIHIEHTVFVHRIVQVFFSPESKLRNIGIQQFYYNLAEPYETNGLSDLGCDYVPLPITMDSLWVLRSVVFR